MRASNLPLPAPVILRVRPVLLASLVLLLACNVVSAQTPLFGLPPDSFGLPPGSRARVPAGQRRLEVPGNRVKQASHMTPQDDGFSEIVGDEFPESIGNVYPEAVGDGSCCEPCYQPCCAPLLSRIYGRGELVTWWTSGMDVPELVTTSVAGTPADQIGLLDAPGTRVLFGNAGLNDDSRLGGRFTLGYRLRTCNPWSVEATFAFLGRESTRYLAASPGTPIIARPFRNTVTGAQDAVQVAVPGELQGFVSINASTEFNSLDIQARRTLSQQCGMHIDFLVGYRQTELDDQIQIADSITAIVAFPPTVPIIPAGTNLSGLDTFQTTNRFYGAQLGFACEVVRSCWSAELQTKLALGSTSADVLIDGSTRITLAGGTPSTQPGSKLALPSNMGLYQQDSFSMIPELNLRLNYAISPCWTASVGYTLVYWSRVARAGDQIDLDVDENQFPLPNLAPAAGIFPELGFVFDDFLAQGLSFGLECRF